jgi:hypothetical protein
MAKKRTGPKTKDIEMTGTGVLEASTYDLFATTSLFWATKSEELLFSASLLDGFQKQKMQRRTLGNNVFSTVNLLSGYALENIFKAIICEGLKPDRSGHLLTSREFSYHYQD